MIKIKRYDIIAVIIFSFILAFEANSQSAEGLSRQMLSLKTSVQSLQDHIDKRLQSLELLEQRYQFCSSKNSLFAPGYVDSDQYGCLALPEPSSPKKKSLKTVSMRKVETGKEQNIFTVLGTGLAETSSTELWSWKFTDKPKDEFKEMIIEGRERRQTCRNDTPRCPAKFDNPVSLQFVSSDVKKPFWVKTGDVNDSTLTTIKIRAYHPHANTSANYEINGTAIPRAFQYRWTGKVKVEGSGDSKKNHQPPLLHLIE